MADASLKAKLIGVEEGLEDALDSVAEASREVNSTLEKLDDTLEDIGSASQTAKSGLNSADEAAENLTESASSAAASTEKLEGSFENIKIDAETLNLQIGQLGDSLNNASGDLQLFSSRVKQSGDEANDATGDVTKFSGALGLLSSANVQAAGTSRLAESGINEMGDAADEATDELIGTASAAELLSLRSSALSINVGFFTIALRNLTTQIPLLVTSLGNLTAAFTGLGTAVGGVGIGGLGVAFGGALAKAEEAGANLNDFQSVMEALEPTSQAFQEALIQALDPLVETQGAIEAFDALLQTVVNTVHAFSRATKAAFEINLTGVDDVQSLQTTLMGLNEAVNENIGEIAGAVADLVVILGDELEAIFSGALEALPGFIRDVAIATEQVIDIVDVATDGLGNFVEELTRLGRAIGAGVAPVLSTFFTIVGDAVDTLILTQEEINNFNEATQNVEGAASSAQEALSGFRMETIASAAKVVALLLAINRLASILGAVVTPLAAAGASIAAISAKASGALSGFVLALDNVSGLIGRNIGGIGRLSQAFELLLPPIGQNTSLLTGLRRKLTGVSDSQQETASETQQLTNELRELRLAFNGVEEEAEEAEEAMEDARPGGFTRLKSSLSSVSEKYDTLRTKQDGIFSGVMDDLSLLSSTLLPTFSVAAFNAGKSLREVNNDAARAAGMGLTHFAGELETSGDSFRAFRSGLGGVARSLSNVNGEMSLSRQSVASFLDELSDGTGLILAARRSRGLNSSLQDTGDTFELIDQKLDRFADTIKNKVRTALINIGGAFFLAAQQGILFGDKIGQKLSEGSLTARNGLSDLKDSVMDTEKSIRKHLLSGAIRARNGLSNFKSSVINTGGEMKSSLAEGIERAGTGLSELKSSASDTREALGKRMIKTLGRLKNRFFDLKGSASDSISSIPGRASGLVNRFGALGRGAVESFAETFETTDSFADQLIGDGLETKGMFEGAVDNVEIPDLRLRDKIANLEDFDQAVRLADEQLPSFGEAITGVKGSLATLKTTNLGAAASAIFYSNTLDNLTTQMIESGGVSMAFGESIEEAKEEMNESGSVTSSFKSSLSTLSTQLATTGGVSGLFAQSVEDAKDEMDDTGSKSHSLYAALTTLSGGFITAASSGSLLGSTTSANTTKFAAQTAVVKGLTSAVKSLAVVSAVMAAGFLTVVAVVGTAAAALMTLGSSGQDAQSLISGLIDTLKNIGQAVMPLVVTAGNAMLDVFDSIKAVGGALVEGLREIGAALGLVSESAGDGEGPMQMLKNAVDTIQPVIKAIGDLTRKFAEALIPAIRSTAEGFAKFLDGIDAEERIKAIAGVVKDVVRALGGLEGVMNNIVNIAGPFFEALAKMSVILGILTAAATAAAVALGIVSINLGIIAGAVSAVTAVLTSPITIIIALVAALGLLLKKLGLLDPLFNVVIGATKGLINIILDLVGVIASVAVDAVGELVGVLVPAGQKFLAAISPVITAFKSVVSALQVVAEITGVVVGVIVGLLGNIVSYVVDYLAPIFGFVLDIIGFVFDRIVTVIGGVIDTIIGYYSALGAFLGTVFDDPVEAIKNVLSGIKDFVMNIFDFIVSTFTRLGGIIKDLFMGIVDTIIDAFLDIPSALKGAFDTIVRGIKDSIAEAWNSTIGGMTVVPSVGVGPLSTPKVTIDKIDKSGNSSESSSGGMPSSDSNEANIADNDRTQDDLVNGGTTAINAGRTGAQAASNAMAPGTGDVKIEEGNTTNIFNQDISADPEDEVQIGRIAKDAMKEAESFKRRQQGN